MHEFISKLFSSDFMGHGYCYLWKPEIVWLHAISDGAIALSYYVIPLALFYFVRKRRDLPFHWMFLMFAFFILGCGTTHLMEVWTLWHGTYRLAGVVKAITAASSIATAALLFPLIPKALSVLSPAQLRAANRELEREILERRRVEQALHKAYDEVESIVVQRTADLVRTNEQLQAGICERRHAEERARLGEAFLAEGQRLSHTGSWAWKVGSGELLFSEETIRILDFDPKQPTQSLKDAMRRIHVDDRAFVQSVLDSAVQERKNYEFEARLALSDASIKYVHCVGHLSDQESADLEFVGAIMDITERKRAEETLQASQAQLAHMSRVTTMGELAASIAHEVNQPLSAIIANGNACLRWLGRDEPNLDEACDAATRMVKEANRASEVIRRMRALLTKSTPRVIPLDVNEVISEVLILTRSQIRRNGVSLRTELASGDTAIKGDPIQLQQVVLNLVVNGIEATNARIGGPRELLIRSQVQRPNSVVVSVCDSGIGIDPAKANRIFEPFFTSKADGMGMGLAISNSIVAAHGGRLWALPNQGDGATFQFSIPALEAA
jgi:C4-dicarboxylate-specific signal transduction histidine kinase